MIWPADYHMHTPLCHHASGWPTDYAARALELGLTEIGFSDHAPLPADDFDNWRMAAAELPRYVEEVTRARQDHPRLTIKLALEIDYLPGYEDWIRDLASRYPWDYLIGSVHYVSGSWDIDNPAKISVWSSRDVDEVWAEYFDRLGQAVRSGLFDIVGHADLPKKFGHRPNHDCTALYASFLDDMQRDGLALELNSAGLRKDCREIYPGPQFLALAHARDIPITFGSDAHAPAEVGLNLAEALDLARATGYTQSCRFTRRQRHFVDL